MIVLPPDFSHVGELDKALISFSRDNDNKDKKLVYLRRYKYDKEILLKYILIGTTCSYLLSLANNLPIEITMDIGLNCQICVPSIYVTNFVRVVIVSSVIVA
jgi:hypothetical protein